MSWSVTVAKNAADVRRIDMLTRLLFKLKIIKKHPLWLYDVRDFNDRFKKKGTL